MANSYYAEGSRTLRKVDDTGGEVWSATMSGGNSAYPLVSVAVSYDRIVGGAGDSWVSAFTPQGAEELSFESSLGNPCLAVDTDGDIYIGSSQGAVFKHNGSDGSEVWSNQVTDSSTNISDVKIDLSGNVICCASGYIVKLDPSGQELWRSDTGQVLHSVEIDKDGYFYAGTNTSVLEYDPQGVEIWETSISIYGDAQNIDIGWNDWILASGGGWIAKVHKDDGSILWAREGSDNTDYDVTEVACFDEIYNIYFIRQDDNYVRLDTYANIIWEVDLGPTTPQVMATDPGKFSGDHWPNIVYNEKYREVEWTTPGVYSFTVPDNVNYIRFYGLGPAGSFDDTYYHCGGGGAGGVHDLLASPGLELTVVVGGAGTGTGTEIRDHNDNTIILFGAGENGGTSPGAGGVISGGTPSLGGSSGGVGADANEPGGDGGTFGGGGGSLGNYDSGSGGGFGGPGGSSSSSTYVGSYGHVDDFGGTLSKGGLQTGEDADVGFVSSNDGGHFGGSAAGSGSSVGDSAGGYARIEFVLVPVDVSGSSVSQAITSANAIVRTPVSAGSVSRATVSGSFTKKRPFSASVVSTASVEFDATYITRPSCLAASTSTVSGNCVRLAMMKGAPVGRATALGSFVAKRRIFGSVKGAAYGGSLDKGGLIYQASVDIAAGDTEYNLPALPFDTPISLTQQPMLIMTAGPLGVTGLRSLSDYRGLVASNPQSISSGNQGENKVVAAVLRSDFGGFVYNIDTQYSSVDEEITITIDPGGSFQGWGVIAFQALTEGGSTIEIPSGFADEVFFDHAEYPSGVITWLTATVFIDTVNGTSFVLPVNVVDSEDYQVFTDVVGAVQPENTWARITLKKATATGTATGQSASSGQVRKRVYPQGSVTVTSGASLTFTKRALLNETLVGVASAPAKQYVKRAASSTVMGGAYAFATYLRLLKSRVVARAIANARLVARFQNTATVTARTFVNAKKEVTFYPLLSVVSRATVTSEYTRKRLASGTAVGTATTNGAQFTKRRPSTDVVATATTEGSYRKQRPVNATVMGAAYQQASSVRKVLPTASVDAVAICPPFPLTGRAYTTASVAARAFTEADATSHAKLFATAAVDAWAVTTATFTARRHVMGGAVAVAVTQGFIRGSLGTDAPEHRRYYVPFEDRTLIVSVEDREYFV